MSRTPQEQQGAAEPLFRGRLSPNLQTTPARHFGRCIWLTYTMSCGRTKGPVGCVYRVRMGWREPTEELGTASGNHGRSRGSLLQSAAGRSRGRSTFKAREKVLRA